MEKYAHIKKINFFEIRKQVISNFLGRFSPTRMVIFLALRGNLMLADVEQIVPTTSATFNGTNTENHCLDYDHSGLKKYNNVTDQGYVEFMTVLNDCIGSILAEECNNGKRKADLDESESQILRALNSPRCNTEQCRHGLYSALTHLSRQSPHARETKSTGRGEDWENGRWLVEDGWWKTTRSWVTYIVYIMTYSQNERRKGLGLEV